MPNFNIGTLYLTYAKTKYFMKGANHVTLGCLGRKYDVTGTFDPEFVVNNVQSLPTFGVPNSKVQVYTVKKSQGGGFLKFQEVSKTVSADLQGRGGSEEVIIAELEFFDLLDGPLLQLVKADPACVDILDSLGKRCVADSVVVVKKLKKVSAADLAVGVDVKVRMVEILDGQVGTNVSSSSYQELGVSPGTVIAFRLIALEKKGNGKIVHKRDNPGL